MTIKVLQRDTRPDPWFIGCQCRIAGEVLELYSIEGDQYTWVDVEAADPKRLINEIGEIKVKPTTDPKYGVNDEGKICNIATGKPIPDDEPIMIFRAKDMLAPQILAYYENLVATSDHKMAVSSRILDFNKFQIDHPERVKMPNTVFPFPEV